MSNTLQADYDAALTEIEVLRQRIGRDATAIERLTRERNEARESLASLQSHANLWAKSCDLVDIERDALRERIAWLEDDREQKQKWIDKLTADLTAAHIEGQDALVERDEAQAALKRYEDVWAPGVARQLDDSTDYIRKVLAERDEALEQVERLTRAITDAITLAVDEGVHCYDDGEQRPFYDTLVSAALATPDTNTTEGVTSGIHTGDQS
jgi:chromosome segregation ATPase